MREDISALRVARMYQRGKTMAAIAKELDCSTELVHRRLGEAGVDKRRPTAARLQQMRAAKARLTARLSVLA